MNDKLFYKPTSDTDIELDRLWQTLSVDEKRMLVGLFLGEITDPDNPE